MNIPKIFEVIIIIGFFFFIVGYVVFNNEHHKNMEVYFEKEIRNRQLLVDSLKVQLSVERNRAAIAEEKIALINIKKKQNKIILHAKKDSIARLAADTIQTIIVSNLPD